MNEPKTLTPRTDAAIYKTDVGKGITLVAVLTNLCRELERELRSLSPPEVLNNADPNDEEAYAKAIKDNDDYVGALQYNGNTVSYMYSKAKNYGNVVLDAHRLSGAKSGQNVLDRIKELVSPPEGTEKLAKELRDHEHYMATYSEPFIGSTDAIARCLGRAADFIERKGRAMSDAKTRLHLEVVKAAMQWYRQFDNDQHAQVMLHGSPALEDLYISCASLARKKAAP